MRDPAVRMVFEAGRSGRSQWEAISSVAEKLGPTRERFGGESVRSRLMRLSGRD